MVEAQGQLQQDLGGDESGDADLGPQDAGAVFDVAVGAGVPDEGGDLRGEGGGAQVEPGQELLGEVEFVVGAVGVGEGEGEGALGLAGGTFAGDAVLLGLGAGGFVSGGEVAGDQSSRGRWC
ncbi:hypothetical protein LRS74_33020 [Streptomyces sp. LX-29]|uniref:hypothetical protein n=1 Tax=Streptomyces sp. LX-29 TaxID=2900152 RepID=UPI00240CFCB6|nr:hypothetical protein [Streptomyces sp. LX-29]WFB11323.1 hypothetical protein LRS74_33020 [Streptomyces sp. LX-29]